MIAKKILFRYMRIEGIQIGLNFHTSKFKKSLKMKKFSNVEIVEKIRLNVNSVNKK